jgi:hypothetical protein
MLNQRPVAEAVANQAQAFQQLEQVQSRRLALGQVLQ